MSRYKHMGEGVYYDTKTGRYFDEENEAMMKELRPRFIGTIYPDALNQKNEKVAIIHKQ